MDFLNGISLSVIAAFIFYIFQVHIPDKKRKQIAKNHLIKTYKEFKVKTIEDFLCRMSCQDKNPDELMTFVGFKEFFEKPSEIRGQTNWHRLMNEYENCEPAFKELLYDIERLQSEVSFILNNFSIHDEELFIFIKRFEEIVGNFK